MSSSKEGGGDEQPVMAVAVTGAEPFPAPLGVRTIEVLAPSDLNEGYQFYVDGGGNNNNQSIKVQVPQGGVRANQHFRAIVVDDEEHVPAAAQKNNLHNIPNGHWRDGLCDCCKFGCCHAQCCLTFWCQPCALGQVLTRMKRTWCGLPVVDSTSAAQHGRQQQQTSAFQVYAVMFAVFLVIHAVLSTVHNVYMEDDDFEEDDFHFFQDVEPKWLIAIRIIRGIMEFALWLLVLIVTIRLRSYIRQTYNIPENSCRGCEDCCCAFWCTSCTICQMARHTADYQTYTAGCCTDDGLTRGAPAVVVV